MSSNKPCPECGGTGKLVYSNTGIENDCMYCNGFGKKPKATEVGAKPNKNSPGPSAKVSAVPNSIADQDNNFEQELDILDVKELLKILPNLEVWPEDTKVSVTQKQYDRLMKAHQSSLEEAVRLARIEELESFAKRYPLMFLHPDNEKWLKERLATLTKDQEKQ